MRYKIIALFALVALLFSLLGAVTAKAPVGNTNTALSATCEWKKLAEYPENDEDIFGHITIDPVNPKIIYAAYGWKIYKSMDCGKTWTAITGKVNYVGDIAVDYKYDNNVFFTTGDGFYRSTDGGIHRTKTLSKGMGRAPIEIDPRVRSIIYTGEYYGNVYKSTDGGSSWTKLADLGKDISSISVSPFNSNIVYVGCETGLYKSINGGITWIKKSSYTYVDMVEISPDYDNIVYIVASDGSHPKSLYKSTDSGSHWSKVININYVYSFAVNPKDPRVIYVGSSGGEVYRSNDRGAHWQAMNSGLPNNVVEIKADPVHPSLLYCITQELPSLKYTKVYRYSCPVANVSNFTAHFAGDSIYLSWTYSNPNDIDYFTILYKQSGSSSYLTLAPQVNNTQVSYSKYNFTTTNTTFDFAISACRETEKSLWVHDTARHIREPVITSIRTFANTAFSEKIKVSWDKTKIDSNADYIKIYKNDPDCSGLFCLPIFVKTINRGSTDFNNGYMFVDGLKFNKKYFITISPSDKDNGFGVDFNSVAKDIFIPDIPTEFEAYSSGKKVTFIWKYSLSSQANIDKFNLFSMLPNAGYLGYVPPSSRTTYYHATSSGKYSFKIAAVKGNSSTYSMLDEAYILNTPLRPVVSMANSGIKVTWDKNTLDSNANKVQVYRSTDKVHYLALAIIDKNTGQYIDTSAPTGTLCYLIKILRVATNEHTDTSDPSLYAEIEFTAPTAPTNLAATATSCSEVHLTWTDNSDNEEHFVIERKESNGSYSTLTTLDPDTTEYTDSTANGGKRYYYRVKASNAVGDSGYSNETSVTVPDCATVPDAPTNLTANAVSTNEIDLTWTDNSDNEDGFKVERKKENGTYSLIKTLNVDTTAYKDTTCSENTTYYYRVKAFNGKGNSNYSNEAHATTSKGETVPNTPTGLSGEVKEDGSVVLKWTDNSDNEDGFKLERKEEGGTYSVISSLQANEVTYTDYGVQRGKIYWYRVRAFNSKGYSFYSNEVSFTIPKESNERKKVVIVLWPDNPNMLVNGVKQEIDPGRGTTPVIIPKWSRTVVPIRAIVEALGGTISWDGVARKVTINFNGVTIYLWIDNPKAKVNGTAKWIDKNDHDVKPIIINDRTMLPLRFVAESLGCKVDWDGTTRTITITYTP